MNADATQEYRSAVQQDVRALGFYRAKSDALCDMVGLAGDLNLVHPGGFRRPKSQLRVYRHLSASLRVRLEHLAQPSFRNSNCDLLLKFGSVELYPALDVSG